MKTVLTCVLGVLLSPLLGSQALACYTVYNRASQVIYHAAQAPVDMRYPLHETLPQRFPGGHLVFSVSDTACPSINRTRQRSVTLLTNIRPGQTISAAEPASAQRDAAAAPVPLP